MYTTNQQFFYATSFFVCNHIYQYYSRSILPRKNCPTLPPCDRALFHFYEYVFYFQTLVIFVCNLPLTTLAFYYSIRFDHLDLSLKPLVKFLINHLMFHIFEITKIHLLINIFIFTQFLQVIIDGVDLILHLPNPSYLLLGATIFCIIVSFAYNLHILGQFYIHLRNCRGGPLMEQQQQQ